MSKSLRRAHVTSGSPAASTRAPARAASRRRAVSRCSRSRRRRGTSPGRPCMAFAVSAMIGSFSNAGRWRISRIAVRPSISGIMMSISTRSMRRPASLAAVERGERLAAVARDLDAHALAARARWRARRCCARRPRRRGCAGRRAALAIARLAQHALALGRQLRLDLVQEQRDLVEQALGRARALDDDRAREAPQLCSSSRVSARPV